MLMLAPRVPATAETTPLVEVAPALSAEGEPVLQQLPRGSELPGQAVPPARVCYPLDEVPHLDSVTLAYLLNSEGYDLHLLSVDYGQRHKKEISYAERCAERLGATFDVGSCQLEVPCLVLEGPGPIFGRCRQWSRQCMRIVTVASRVDRTLHCRGGRQIVSQVLQDQGQIQKVFHPRAALSRPGVCVQLLGKVVRTRIAQAA
jgi:hypothetical protein